MTSVGFGPEIDDQRTSGPGQLAIGVVLGGGPPPQVVPGIDHAVERGQRHRRPRSTDSYSAGEEATCADRTDEDSAHGGNCADSNSHRVHLPFAARTTNATAELGRGAQNDPGGLTSGRGSAVLRAVNAQPIGQDTDRISRLVGDADRPPTYEDLLEASDGLRQPVLLPGLCGATTAGQRWTLDYLFGIEPEVAVDAEFYVDADRRKKYEHRSVLFRELSENMKSDPTRWYLAEQDLDKIFPLVAQELPRLPVLPDDARDALRLVFFGNDSQSATHFHVRDQAILEHLKGDKRVILAGPEATSALATNSPFGGRPQFSTHGPEDGGDALSCFTDLCGDKAFHVDLEPGDSLFIPVHWWHWVEGQGECLSVTTFWRASIREWAFPHPGIRASTAVALGETAKVVRGALGLVKKRR